MSTFNDDPPVSACIIILVLVVLLRGCLAVAATSDSIARATDIPGKFEPEQCLPFARALVDRIHASGGTAAVFAYWWRDQYDRSHGHAVVLYVGASGRVYAMDNEMWSPVRVNGLDELTIARYLVGTKTAITKAKFNP